jgi:hypothetical protein
MKKNSRVSLQAVKHNPGQKAMLVVTQYAETEQK